MEINLIGDSSISFVYFNSVFIYSTFRCNIPTIPDQFPDSSTAPKDLSDGVNRMYLNFKQGVK